MKFVIYQLIFDETIFWATFSPNVVFGLKNENFGPQKLEN
jgi:hypothetical protein